MDPSVFVNMFVGMLLPFLISTIKNPKSIANLKRSLPALKIISDAFIQLIALIEGKPLEVKAAKTSLHRTVGELQDLYNR